MLPLYNPHATPMSDMFLVPCPDEIFVGTAGCNVGAHGQPYGSKDPNKWVLGPKYYNMNGIWALKPYYLGPWTLRVKLCSLFGRCHGHCFLSLLLVCLPVEVHTYRGATRTATTIETCRNLSRSSKFRAFEFRGLAHCFWPRSSGSRKTTLPELTLNPNPLNPKLQLSFTGAGPERVPLSLWGFWGSTLS